MTLSEHIRTYMMHADRPVTTREITDAMPAGTGMPSVSSWLSVWIRRGIARRCNSKRPYTYRLSGAPAMVHAPRRRATARPASPNDGIDRPAPAYPLNHDARRHANRSAMNMHVAIQQSISANLEHVVERLTRDAIRRYLELMQRKPETDA